MNFDALTLPAVLDGSVLEATMTADATVGVSFTQLTHKTGGDFDITTSWDSTSDLAEADGRLWELAATLRNGTEVLVGPADAGAFQAYDVSDIYGGTAFLFEWTRVPIAGADDLDRVWVRVLAHLEDEDDPHLVWTSWFGRERGESCTITSFTSPVVFVENFAAPRDVENGLEASKRLRLLLPQLSFNANGQFWENVAAILYCTANGAKTMLAHEMGVPLFGLFNADNEGAGAYRRTLYGHHCDTRGFRKGFRVVGAHNEDEDEAHVKLGFVHYPRWSTSFAKARLVSPSGVDLLPPSLYRNSYSQPYSVRIGVLTAATDDWWYDLCEVYRDWYEENLAPVPHAVATDRSTWTTGGGIWSGSINIPSITSIPTADVLPRFLAVTEGYRLALGLNAIPTVFEIQSTGPDGGGLNMSGDDGVSKLSSGLRSICEAALAQGMIPSFFTEPTFVQAGTVSMPWDMILVDSNGRVYQTPVIDQLSSEARARLIQVYRNLISRQGLRSPYLDLFVGFGPLRNHPTGLSELADALHSHWGSSADQTIGRRLFLQELRAAIAQEAGSAATPVSSETPEEGLSELVDLTQDGYHFVPSHLALAEPFIFDPAGPYSAIPGIPDLTADDYPMSARQMTPPIWQCVHHQWSTTGRFGITPLNIGLATNLNYANGPTYPGMTADELIDAHCMTAAHIWINGMRHLLDHDTGHDFPLVEKVDSMTWQADATNDPDGTGLTIFAFYALLQQLASGGGPLAPYLVHGKMLRPFQVDIASADVSKQENPIFACRQAAPAAWRAVPYVYGFGYASQASIALWDQGPGTNTGTQAFDVPQVLHSVWQDAEGHIVLVLVNWSDDEADWLGTLDIPLYGGDPDDNAFVEELEADGTWGDAVEIDGEGSTIGNVGTPDIQIGVFAPRSVKAYRLSANGIVVTEFIESEPGGSTLLGEPDLDPITAEGIF